MTVPAVIELQGIWRTYEGPPPLTALRGVDMTIGRGELVTVVGPSGSGKSTLLNLVGLLDRPTEGTYLLNGIDTGGLGERERTALRGRRIGFVFQAFHLLASRSALDNVMLSMMYTGLPKRRRRQAALDMLDRVGLAGRAFAAAAQLSGGERQRVAIARALAGGPSLLLCDEPTGNLDSASAAQVMDLVSGLHRDGYTVLVVTHNHAVAAQGTRTIAMRDGAVAGGSTGGAP